LIEVADHDRCRAAAGFGISECESGWLLILRIGSGELFYSRLKKSEYAVDSLEKVRTVFRDYPEVIRQVVEKRIVALLIYYSERHLESTGSDGVIRFHWSREIILIRYTVRNKSKMNHHKVNVNMLNTNQNQEIVSNPTSFNVIGTNTATSTTDSHKLSTLISS